MKYEEYINDPHSYEYNKYIFENSKNIKKHITQLEYEYYKSKNNLKYTRIEKINKLKQISENEHK